MFERNLTRQTIAWFYDHIKRNQMNLQPPYQRKSVWSRSYKRYFIDTILHNYSSPPIFLNHIIGSDGVVKYEVVDGRQRLEAIVSFIEGEIPVTSNFGDATVDNKYFQELTDDAKKKFWNYLMSVEDLSDPSPAIIKETFDRLNRNVAKLTSQELRHARYSGTFIALISAIADDPFWEDNDLSRPATIRRMKDVEFISELFLLTMHGIQKTTKDELDFFYSEYDEEIPEEKKHRKAFKWIQSQIEAMGLNISGTRLKNYSDFYSLWAAFLALYGRSIDLIETKKALTDFFSKIESKSKSKDMINYLETVKSQPNEEKNRSARAEILKVLIKTK
ncbi:MAG: DUF262 domain-containing protein [Candidatus Omnitrophota bacterium]